MEIVVNHRHKSIPSGTTFKLPNFCVLTGKNGSGKTHLLEALNTSTVATITSEGKLISNRMYIAFNGLNPRIEESFETSKLNSIAYELKIQINDFFHLSNYERNDLEQLSRELTEEHKRTNDSLIITIIKLIESTGKFPNEFTPSDISKHLDFEGFQNNPIFTAKFAMAFKIYSNRQLKNELTRLQPPFTSTTKSEYLDQEEFTLKYGPPPWELVNSIFSRAKIPYEVTAPNFTDFDISYNFTIKNKTSRADISVNELSSGEKVLLSLALAIYNTTNGDSLPELLMLDEPDAPLHPQFSKLLIEILQEVIVQQAGVKVILTTHSPSTVAMAPENSVFEINTLTRKPLKVSNSQAVHTLTEGADSLNVSFESRRQIFVESKYDVVYFDKLFRASSRRRDFTFQPVFIEPHSGTSNCADVKNIVNSLRSTGNDLVSGIIDFDNTNKPTDSIFVLGDSARYSIENYILEPLYVCLCLIRNGKKKFTDFGVDGGKDRYSDIPNLSQHECQTMIDSLLTKVGLPLNDLVPTPLDNGFELYYPQSFLLHNGHTYEALLKSILPELGAIIKSKGDAALKLGVLEVIADYPEFLPIEILDTFSKILEPKKTTQAN